MDLPNPPFYRRWSFLLAGVIGLTAITALLGWRGLQQVAEPPATTLPATTVTGPPPTTTPPTSYGPTSKPVDQLWSHEGTDDQGTVTSTGFRAPFAWRIEWSFDCSNFKRYDGGNFKITGNGAFNSVDIQRFGVKASGTQRFTGGGFGHLLVESVCKRWRVRVLAG